jgi:hypothetical protein
MYPLRLLHSFVLACALASLVACGTAQAAESPSAMAMRAVLRTSDVPGAKPDDDAVGPYLTAREFLAHWGISQPTRSQLASAYGRAGFRAGAIHFIDPHPKQSGWASNVVVARSPAAAVSLADEMHDIWIRAGARLISDPTSLHAWADNTIKHGRLTESMIYAVRGDLVVSVDHWDPRGISRQALQRKLTGMLDRSGAVEVPVGSATTGTETCGCGG